MKFKIPSQFDLMGQEWTVSRAEGLMTMNMYGMTHSQHKHIAVEKDLDPDDAGHTFFHELTHAILGTLGRQDLNGDEAFVDTFAGLLWQAIKTSE
jgi:Zn-dependent peptidase ImmA (M78 family)